MFRSICQSEPFVDLTTALCNRYLGQPVLVRLAYFSIQKENDDALGISIHAIADRPQRNPFCWACVQLVFREECYCR
jgi:hypothetical protein